jgi:predicted house-cleaning noncanonical NTP pyrophosphatase (MazG superfamily)
MQHPKLVRDKIPDIIRQNRQVPVTHIADDKEYWQRLKDKIQEEVDEFLNCKDEEIEKELVDIVEVVYAIADFKKIDKKELEESRRKKAEKNGGFKKRIILEKE